MLRVWDRWIDKVTGNVIESGTIITVAPNPVCAPIHNRMPAILAREDYAAWLGEIDATVEQLKTMLRPCPMGMEAMPISTKVNSPKNEGAELLEKAS